VAIDPLTRGTRPDLLTFRTWRSALDQLASGIDRAMYAELSVTNAVPPW
jgi:hypothetical protein